MNKITEMSCEKQIKQQWRQGFSNPCRHYFYNLMISYMLIAALAILF